ncbi:imelysin family protein [Chondromyces crocatus]|uniref:Imelysin-like domain-containing protein n=1 Tax=Chondromyces crocatus TaxID=52 RepID=A0A0K1EEW8_CHOCO|nr:imelysin family protein [Chondromyces crocatus]AKT39420.1 uncharacterized protein CMC5_035670 [Chondromyces crocatus]
MRRSRDVRLLAGAPIAAGFVLYALSSGCERVSYYSISGGDPSGPGAPTTTTTGPGAGPGTEVTRAQVLAAVGACAAPLYQSVATAVAEFDTATRAAVGGDAEARTTAREAWTKTIGLWQQAEVIRIGAAGPAALPHGQALRDYMYSWPLTSRCLMEQTLTSKAYEAPTFAQTALINMRGLAAAEYLLFYEGSDNACNATASINSAGTWAALGAAEIAARKAAYAAVVTTDLTARSRQLADSWAPDQGNFGAILGAAGTSGSPFASAQAALNAVSDGMFYVEREVKDMKLGRPLGVWGECASTSCPEAVESRYALIAAEHVKNNLIGFRRLFAGCEESENIGFDDLLVSIGAGSLAERMTADVDGAIATAEAMSNPDLVEGLSTRRSEVEALHASVKRITDALKTEFVSVLDLELPQVVEGDND